MMIFFGLMPPLKVRHSVSKEDTLLDVSFAISILDLHTQVESALKAHLNLVYKGRILYRAGVTPAEAASATLASAGIDGSMPVVAVPTSSASPPLAASALLAISPEALEASRAALAADWRTTSPAQVLAHARSLELFRLTSLCLAEAGAEAGRAAAAALRTPLGTRFAALCAASSSSGVGRVISQVMSLGHAFDPETDLEPLLAAFLGEDGQALQEETAARMDGLLDAAASLPTPDAQTLHACAAFATQEGLPELAAALTAAIPAASSAAAPPFAALAAAAQALAATAPPLLKPVYLVLPRALAAGITSPDALPFFVVSEVYALMAPTLSGFALRWAKMVQAGESPAAQEALLSELLPGLAALLKSMNKRKPSPLEAVNFIEDVVDGAACTVAALIGACSKDGLMCSSSALGEQYLTCMTSAGEAMQRKEPPLAALVTGLFDALQMPKTTADFQALHACATTLHTSADARAPLLELLAALPASPHFPADTLGINTALHAAVTAAAQALPTAPGAAAGPTPLTPVFAAFLHSAATPRPCAALGGAPLALLDPTLLAFLLQLQPPTPPPTPTTPAQLTATLAALLDKMQQSAAAATAAASAGSPCMSLSAWAENGCTLPPGGMLALSPSLAELLAGLQPLLTQLTRLAGLPPLAALLEVGLMAVRASGGSGGEVETALAAALLPASLGAPPEAVLMCGLSALATQGATSAALLQALSNPALLAVAGQLGALLRGGGAGGEGSGAGAAPKGDDFTPD